MVLPAIAASTRSKQPDRRAIFTRFDLDFDLPEHFLPEFPRAIFLTTRQDLGDVSQGQARDASTNFYELFKACSIPKQLEGLRLLLTPFPQQQFNLTDDRRSAKPSLGVACLDCHANGHTNAATHLVGDIRPQELRHRIDTPVAARREHPAALRLAARAEDRRGLHRVRAARGLLRRRPGRSRRRRASTSLDRGSQVHAMAEFQELLDFPPAPKLTVSASSTRRKASEAELRGEKVFFGKGQCAVCHAPPYYTDNSMHDLKLERFFKPRDDQRPDPAAGRADQDLPAARHQGLAALPPRRPAADARGHGRVLQPDPRGSSHAGREGRSTGLPARALSEAGLRAAAAPRSRGRATAAAGRRRTCRSPGRRAGSCRRAETDRGSRRGPG